MTRRRKICNVRLKLPGIAILRRIYIGIQTWKFRLIELEHENFHNFGMVFLIFLIFCGISQLFEWLSPGSEVAFFVLTIMKNLSMCMAGIHILLLTTLSFIKKLDRIIRLLIVGKYLKDREARKYRQFKVLHEHTFKVYTILDDNSKREIDLIVYMTYKDAYGKEALIKCLIEIKLSGSGKNSPPLNS
jgi:hypothetical protein